MKTIRSLAIGLAVFLFSSVVSAQNIVNVAPGYGSLNDSISVHGAGTYVLKAGGWYGLNQPIEIDTSVTIIGTIPAAGQMPAIIQTGATSAGVTFTEMFNTYSNLTLKHVFLVDADLNDGYGAGIIFEKGPGRIVMDSIVVDPVGNHFFSETPTTGVSIYLKNSLFMRKGHTLGLSDGYFFTMGANDGWDTLYVENNTFVDPGYEYIKGPNAENDSESFTWINHNTFLFGKEGFKDMFGDRDTYITNNLMYMMNFVPMPHFEGHPDAYPNDVMHGLILDDTLLNESLPSVRRHFIEYNSNYRPQGDWDIVNFVNKQPWGRIAYLYNFIPSITYIDSSRETRIYNDKKDFPYFFCANNMSDTDAAISNYDPDFVDQKIYQLTDSADVWADSCVHQLYDANYSANSNLWPDFFYNADTSVGNPTTWPRFNGAYTNSMFMTASIGGLPLGDLNWFPSQKKVWKEYQQKLMQHIEAEDQTQMIVTAIKDANGHVPTKFTLLQNYPNPFNPTTQIQYSLAGSGMVSLKVYNVLGQEVATLINEHQSSGNHIVNFNASRFASGVYFYTLREGSNSITKKMLLLK